MYDLYFKLFDEYSPQYGPNTLIFLMVGKFYELYDLIDADTGEGRTSMRRAADLLNIQLTRRSQDGPKKEDGLFAGVPVESLHKYAQVLTREGWTIVVVDQIKNAAGDVIDRKPSRILSPGTHLETASELGCGVAAIWMESCGDDPPQYSISIFETTTGETTSAQGVATGRADSWNCDELLHIVQVHAPREIVFVWRGPRHLAPDEATLRSRLGLRQTPLYFRNGEADAQGNLEHSFAREEYLTAATRIPSMLPIHSLLHIQRGSLIERSLCQVLRYIEDHFPSSKQHITRHSIFQSNTSVFLGNNILEQINVLPTSRGAGQQQKCILSLFDRVALTSMGRRSLRARLLNPSRDPVWIEERLKEVSFFHAFLKSAQAQAQAQEQTFLHKLQKSLRGMYDITRLHHCLAVGYIDAEQILQLEQTYEMMKSLAEFLQSTPFAQPQALEANVKKYLQLFSTVFSVEKAQRQIKGELVSPLADSQSAELAELEQKAAALMAAWRVKLNSFLFWAQVSQDALRMEQKDGEWQIRGPRAVLVAVQKRCDTLKDSPLTQVTANLKKSTPNTLECKELEVLNTELHSLYLKHSSAYKIACSEACIPLWESLLSQQFQQNWVDWLCRIDESLALASVAADWGFTRPVILESSLSSFQCKGLFHPLLMNAQTRLEYVKHDISLGALGAFGSEQRLTEKASARGWLLYGVNASGKSSLMKSIGIAVLLAQAGSFVPAESATLSPFSSMYSRIWSLDNLWAGLSSFAVEMTELRDITRNAGPRSLVLGDEVCSGTESQSATALVGATLEWLLERNACFLFATHLHDLLRLPVMESKGVSVYHLRVFLDGAGRLVYDRHLRPGPGSSKYGLEVAKAMDLPHELLERAFENRRMLGGEVDAEEAPSSAWNAALSRRSCEVCGHAILRDLEVHHIQQRAHGGNNSLRNLIVVCSKCHDAHHAGQLEIGPLRLTSEGSVRETATVSNSSEASTVSRSSSSKWTAEQKQEIQSTLEQFKSFTLKRVLYELEKKGISISAATLRKWRG